MAIEPFAEKIRADTRAYNEKIAKRNRDNEINDLLKGLGTVGVMKLGSAFGTTLLQDNMSDFLKNEKTIFSSQREFGNAVNGYAKMQAENKKILDSNTPNFLYYYQSEKDSLENELSVKLPDEMTGEAGLYNFYIDQEARKRAKTRYDNLQKGLTLGSKLGTQKNYSAVTAREIQKITPTTLTGAIVRGLGSILPGGKSQSERKQDLVTFLKTNTFAKDAQAFNKFYSTYTKSGNISNSLATLGDYKTPLTSDPKDPLFGQEFSLLDQVQNKVKIRDLYVETQKSDAIVENNIIMDKTTTIKTNRNTGATTENTAIKAIVLPDEFTDAVREEHEKELFNTLVGQFNYAKDGAEILNPEAFGKFSEAASALNLDITQYSNMSEYEQVGALFTKFATPKNIIDPEKNTARLEVLKQALEGGKFQTFYDDYVEHIGRYTEKTPPTTEQKATEKFLYNRLTDLITNITGAAEFAAEGIGVKGEIPAIRKPVRDDVIGTSNWNKMNRKQQKLFYDGYLDGKWSTFEEYKTAMALKGS